MITKDVENCNKYKYDGGYIYMNGIKHAKVIKTETRRTMNKDVTILTVVVLGITINNNKIEYELTLLDEQGNCA